MVRTGPVPSPALMYGGVTKIWPNSYAHARITDGLMPYSAHEESLLRLCFLLHVLPGYLPETESASTLCPDNVTAIVHLHIKDPGEVGLDESNAQIKRIG
jgi:hypothetical protein